MEEQFTEEELSLPACKYECKHSLFYDILSF